MKIKERIEFLSKPKPFTAAPGQSVLDASKEMSARNIGSVVVTDAENRVVGLVTERDLMRRIVAENKDPSSTKLSDIMTTSLRLAREDDNVVDWLRVMSNERFRRLPVVDADGKLVSIMTQGDFVSYTWPELLKIMSDRVEQKLGINNQHIWIIAGVLVYGIAMAVIMAAV
ncbi:CBS domain-containing protein [Roseibium denhamense]|uniref:CBS domain-containing protein n=1 Tax=Roseibium denhamense TaxID=76305 RepID=A0ABY1NJG0_9HYPH|nr:CBS domain-containing protein [Roseibium denhamense]MTI06716.1 CBS domain-containing protein [Roseibium denhamense]SMP10524.1 CBS domain-containing protein [Roseibium denhamense]